VVTPPDPAFEVMTIPNSTRSIEVIAGGDHDGNCAISPESGRRA
jgi:hypothetical protein